MIIATDSQALLARIKSGWLPDGWIPPSEAPVMSRIVWVYVPGHAGVAINEEADRLVAAATDASSLTLYHSDIKLSEHRIRTNTTALLRDSSEGIRLLSSGTSYAKSARSRKKGPERGRSNQLLTGNISMATLLFKLSTLAVVSWKQSIAKLGKN